MVYLSEVSILIALAVRWNQTSYSDMRGVVSLKNTLICILLSTFLLHLMQMSFDIHFIAVEWHYLSRVRKIHRELY